MCRAVFSVNHILEKGSATSGQTWLAKPLHLAQSAVALEGVGDGDGGEHPLPACLPLPPCSRFSALPLVATPTLSALSVMPLYCIPLFSVHQIHQAVATGIGGLHKWQQVQGAEGARVKAALSTRQGGLG